MDNEQALALATKQRDLTISGRKIIARTQVMLTALHDGITVEAALVGLSAYLTEIKRLVSKHTQLEREFYILARETQGFPPAIEYSDEDVSDD